MEEGLNLASARRFRLILSIGRLATREASHLLAARTRLLNDAGKILGVSGEVGLLVSSCGNCRAHKERKEVFRLAGNGMTTSVGARHGAFREKVVELEEEALLA